MIFAVISDAARIGCIRVRLLMNMKRKKVNKLIRRVRIAGKKSKKLSRKKILLWLNKNLREHPFILGIVSSVWIGYIIRMFFENAKLADQLKFHLKLVGAIGVSWLVLVVFSNALRDRQKIKWYFRKRFVFLMLIIFYPFGLILLWVGSQFKRITKIIFTVIFTSIFLFSNFYQEKRHYIVLNMSPFDNVIETVKSKKKKVFLKNSPSGTLERIRLKNTPRNEKMKLAVSDIYSRCSQSIVSIKTKDKDGNQIGLGSGFVVSKDGVIVTNSHVIESAHKAEIKAADKIYEDVYLVKNMPNMDIAILKIDANNLSPLVVGDSDELISGEFIVALGNPLGFEQSVSSGIISAIRSNRDMKLIQMTVPISPGSSGGPVFNEYGEVIGIATIASFFMAQNVNFAIPINYLKKITK